MDIDDLVTNRRIAQQRVRNAVAHGDVLAAHLVQLELAAEPFFLGEDCNEDDSDLAVFP